MSEMRTVIASPAMSNAAKSLMNVGKVLLAIAGAWLLIFVGTGLYGMAYGFMAGFLGASGVMHLPPSAPMSWYYVVLLLILIVFLVRRRRGRRGGRTNSQSAGA